MYNILRVLSDYLGEWITVKDKKQKKTQPADEKPQQLPQKTPNEKSDKVKLQSLPVEHAAPASSTYVEDNSNKKILCIAYRLKKGCSIE
jgi:hypothetical protein